MSQQNNDDLERFFQKVSGQPDIPFEERDWEKLEKQLDISLPVVPQTGGNVVIRALVLTSILVITGGIFITRINPPELTSATTGIKPNNSAEPNHNAIADNIKSPNKTAVNRNRKIQLPGTGMLHRINAADVHPETTHLKLQVKAHTGISSDSVRTAENAGVEAQQSDAEKETVNLPVITAEENLSRDSFMDKDPSPTGLRRWSILLSIGPDFSSTGLNNFTTPGRYVGAGVSYHLFKRMSIQAGAAWSEKKYTSDGGEYKPPKGYWKRNTNGVIPEEIFGRCGVIELPLTVQYEVANFKKGALQLSAGISSYIMLDESYRFAFSSPNPGAREGWAARESSRYFFSIATFAAVYERRIRNNVSLGIQPFIKVPVKEIGWSQLELYSIGCALNVRYRFGENNIDVKVK